MSTVTKPVSPQRPVGNTAAGRIASVEPATVDQLTERNIELIARLENSALAKRTNTDRTVDAITDFCGRMLFVYVHVVWFGFWIILNIAHVVRFDPYPFNLLTLVVSLEAIFLSTFILISQNRHGRIAERRSHLDLQINLLSEQENTKMLTMLQAIQTKLGIEECEPGAQAMMEMTEPDKLVAQIEHALEADTA